MERIERASARGLLVVREERSILLAHFEEPDTGARVWMTPGGGVEAGETLEEAARREVAEETGLERFDLGPLVWRRTHEFTNRGRPFRQVDHFFLVWTHRFDPCLDANPAADEAASILGLRWWTLEEMVGSGETFVPSELCVLLARLLDRAARGGVIDVVR